MSMTIGMSAAYSSNRFGIWDESSGSYTHWPSFENILTCIQQASKMGFAAIEIESLAEKQSTEVYTQKNISKIRETSQRFGVMLAQYLPFYVGRMLTNPNPEERKKAVKIFRRETEIGKWLGAELIELPASPIPNVRLEWKTVYAGGPPTKVHVEANFSWREAWENYVDAVSRCADIVEDAGLKLAIEPMPRYIVNNSDAMLRLLDDVSSESLGVNLDTGHLFVQKEIVPIAIEKLGKRILAAHLSDNDGETEYHWAPGKGKIDWEGIIRALNKVNYNGVLNIEVSGVKELDREFYEGKKHIQAIMQSLKISTN